MRSPTKLCATLPLALCILANACIAGRPPLADNLTLVPVSDTAEIAAGLDIVYVYGTDEGVLNHVACDREGGCWYSGDIGFVSKKKSRTNSVVIRTAPGGTISWARSYQINDTYTRTNGLLPTGDGGALLYGNSFIGTIHGGISRGRIQPVYEKLDGSGIAQWGATVPFGFIKPWSAVSDAIRLANGGYALTGAGTLNIDGDWYGLVLALDASGSVNWFKFMRVGKDQTLSLYLTQLPDGHVLVAGYDASAEDVFLVDLLENGKPEDISIIHIRGQEYPVGFVTLGKGPAIVAQQKMPNGAMAAVIIQLDSQGAVQGATRYRFVDGFNPYDVIPLPGHAACIYGVTEASENRKSLAFVLDANGNPSSALELKGGSVFESGTLLSADQLVFAGGRTLGADQHMSGIIVKWKPAVHNDAKVLADIKRDSPKVVAYPDQTGTVENPKNPSLRKFGKSRMKSRLVYSAAAATTRGSTPVH